MKTDKKECRGFGGGYWDEDFNVWVHYDNNSLCSSCKLFNHTAKKPLQEFIGWCGETEHCRYYESKHKK